MKRIYSFPPVIDDNSRVLLLGSAPGVKSLEAQQYYAHPQNAFWKILFSLFNEPFSENYDTRLQTALRNGVALWDIIESCERQGSSDSAIRNEIHNPISKLLEEYPNISAVFCNGQKAEKSLKKNLSGDFNLPVILLPSSSPLHTVPLQNKIESWKIIKNYL